jgi:hypothetical protein
MPPFRFSRDQFFRLAPGILLSATIAAAAGFLNAHYATPVMLFTLLLGMAFNFLHTKSRPCACSYLTATHISTIL